MDIFNQAVMNLHYSSEKKILMYKSEQKVCPGQDSNLGYYLTNLSLIQQPQFRRFIEVMSVQR